MSALSQLSIRALAGRCQDKMRPTHNRDKKGHQNTSTTVQIQVCTNTNHNTNPKIYKDQIQMKQIDDMDKKGIHWKVRVNYEDDGKWS